MEIYIIILFAVIGVVLALIFSGHKCPHCGKRNKEVVSSKFVDTTVKKSDGSNDKRYKKTGFYRNKIICQSCNKSFNVQSEKNLVSFATLKKNSDLAMDNFNKAAQEELAMYKKKPSKSKKPKKDKGTLSERLIDKYGEEFGKAISNCTFSIGMTTKMIEAPAEELAEIENEPTYANDSYYGKVNFRKQTLGNSKQVWYYMNSEKLIIQNEKITDIISGDHTKELEELTKSEIIELLVAQKKQVKVGDIDKFLQYDDVEEIERLCGELFNDGKVKFAGNKKYFVKSQTKEKPKKDSASNSEKVDVKAELKKFKDMLDDGLITQEQYDAKSNELLGL